MRQFILPLLFALGCVQATASDTIVKATEVQFTNPYASAISGVSLPSITLPPQSVSVNISDALSKVGQVGQLSFVVDQNTLHSNSGDFSFVDELKVSLTPDANNSSGLPELTVIDLLPTSDQKTSSDLTVQVVPDGSTLLQYFASGGLKMNFTFTVSGHPPASIDVVDTLTADVSIMVNKSVSDIGK